MKTIGIIGAMEEEVAVLKPKMEMISAKNIVGVEFSIGKLNGKNVVLVRSGIGKVNAAVCVQVLCDMYGVDGIINTGVAGALDQDLDIGDIVISKDVAYHDFDVRAFGYEPGVIPRMSQSVFPADETLLAAATQSCEEVLTERKTVVGRIVSGDVFVSAQKDKQRIAKLCKASCVEMEGAAVGHACYLNKIPFIVIRSISDKATESASVDFDAFAAEAAANAGAIVERIISLL